MEEVSSIVNNLEGVIRELKGVDELPHSVDDTLIDRLMDSIQTTGTVQECIVVESNMVSFRKWTR